MQVPALEALVGWFAVKEHQANWCLRLEGLLLKGPDFLLKLLNIFKCQETSAKWLKSCLFSGVLDLPEGLGAAAEAGDLLAGDQHGLSGQRRVPL